MGHSWLACFLGLAFLAACSSSGSTSNDSGGNEQTLESARQGYRKYKQRTAEPVPISSQIFALCRLPTAAEDAFANSLHGKDLYLLDWLNEGAQKGYAQNGSQPFPVGATIVKEKLVRVGAAYYEVAALGFMLKRDAGFDAAHGDWEFAYWETGKGFISDGNEASYCGGCHASSSTDFVFLDDSWRN
ncbi:MAG: cytochrome P460 family protein [Myxococcota bacterium]